MPGFSSTYFDLHTYLGYWQEGPREYVKTYNDMNTHPSVIDQFIRLS